MSNLCAFQHSPQLGQLCAQAHFDAQCYWQQQSPWHNSCLHYFAICSPSPWNTATPSDNTALAYKSLRVSTSHFMMLGYPQLLERAEGRQDGSSNPYWELSIVTLPRCSGRQPPWPGESTKTLKTIVLLPLAAPPPLGRFLSDTWLPSLPLLLLSGMLISMKFSAELDCSDLLALIHQPKAP